MPKELAVIFPGMGYHTDKPLLYYSKKIARAKGYEVIDLAYEFDYDVHTADKKQVFEDAFAQTVAALSDVDFTAYERVVFIGKSIGTLVAAKYNQDYDVVAELVVFTPVMETLYVIGDSDCIIFHGSADPLCDTEELVEYCQDNALTYAVIPNGNHSLETGDVLLDMENLMSVMKTVDRIL